MAEKIRVLYVDDETTLLDLCKTYLERLGDVTVTTSASAPEAIRLLEKERFEAIVSDYQMPEMDGIEFLKHLKAKGDKTPFIIFTSKGREEVVIEALNSGADFYLQKGGEPKAQFAELAHKIRHAVSFRQTGDDLRASEEKYRRFIETANEGIWQMDGQFATTFVNQKMAEMLGYTSEEMKGRNVSSFMHPDDRADHASRMEGRRKGRADQYERRFIKKDGTVIWTIVSATALEDPDGMFKGSFAMFTDITERKKAELALRKERDFANSIVGTAQAIILILDTEGHIVYMNPYMEGISGYMLEELKGKDWFKTFLPSHTQESTRSLFRKAIGNTQTRGNVDVIITKGGRERLIEWYDKTLKGAEGSIEGLLAIGQDITERRRAEEALKRNEERYRAVVEDQTEFICRFTPDGRLTFVNDAYCRYFTLDKDRCLAHPHSVILPPEDVRQMKQHLASLTRENPVATIEHRIIMPSGEVRWQRWNDRAIFSENGDVVEYQSVGRDITEIKNAEKSLLEREAYYRAIFENTGTASVIVEEDTTISLTNEGFAVLSGYPREEIEGKRRWTEFVVKEDLERMLAQHYSRRKDRKKAERNYEFRFVRKSGEVRNIYLSIDVIPGTKKSIASLLDITEYKKAEQALRESEEKYRLLFENANDAIYLHEVSREGPRKIFAANEAACRMLGYTHEELLRMTIDDIDVPEQMEKIPAILARLFSEGNAIFETEHLRKDGSRVPVLVSIRTFDLHGTMLMLSIVRNITERKRAEETLRENEERYRTLVASVNEAIIFQEKTGEILTWNRAAERLFGVTAREVMGHTATSLKWKTIREDGTEFPDSEHPSMHTLATGEACKNVVMGITNDEGRSFWVNINTSPLFRQGDAKPYAVVVSFLDITERKQAEETLRETNEYLQKLIDFANAPIIVWDPDFRITRFNHAFEHLTGRIEQEVLGQKIDILFPADSREASLALIKKTLEGERWETVEIPILASDGTIHTVLWNTANILTAEAELISTIAQGVDITERKRAEDMIKSALAEKEVLLQEIHHRVKNNLAGIISLIDLQIGSVSDPVNISLLKDLETRIRSMALVHESLYRTEDLTHISFTYYTENLTRYLFQAYGTGTDIRCRIEMGDVPMPIETAIPCGLVMSEIVTNSLKYAFPRTFSCEEIRGEPCTITLTLHREGSDYLLKIADNGTGIPEGTDVTTSHSLGLFLIRFIVKHQMRGSLEVSTAGGTAYTIRFPAPEVKE